MNNNTPYLKVSIIITAHNYAQFLAQCIESALNQNFNENYEIIVVNDGSIDNTSEILKGYEDNSRIRILNLEGVGLACACNRGIALSKGEYIIRLDADDYFDENILLVESNLLDRKQDIGMVYCDYHKVNEEGEILDYTRLIKVNNETRLLNRPPLAAGAMYRKTCYDAIGGYNETLRYQEDYDFWMRFIERFKVYNINLPLMYYRQHESSMSKNYEGRMDARREVKRSFVEKRRLDHKKKIMAIIPAMSSLRSGIKLPTYNLSGKPVIGYAIQEVLKTKLIDKTIVSTENESVARLSRQLGAEAPFLRPKELARYSVPIEEVILHAVEYLREKDNYSPDIIALLYFRSIFLKEKHISEAIHSLFAHNTDSVISVVEDITFHWKPSDAGLKPVGYQKRFLREEKEIIYKENGALYVFRTENLISKNLLGKKVGYIEMKPYESIRLETEYDIWVAKQMIKNSWGQKKKNLKNR
ncbi:MAG: glycosyltransferase [Candidatus Omnitrophica bacterium]|nr:glycosyltransferase [Candidatus Omnitrophota bacterium]